MKFFSSKINTNFNYSDPKVFVVCQWQKDKSSPSKYYLIYRWTFAIYFNFVVILSLITAEQDKNLILYPIFLTNWNVVLNALSSLLLALIVTQDYKKVTEMESDSNKISAVLKLSWFLATVSTVLAISLSIIYWPLIYTGRDKGINDALTHAGNAIILFIDLFINAHPPRYGHFIYQLYFGLIYVLFSIIYTIAGGVNRSNEPFIYSVLNWKYNTLNTVIFTILTLVFLAAMHFILTAFIHLKILICKKYYSEQQTSRNGGIENVSYTV